MKEGYVTLKRTSFCISGAPGTGKSSFLKLLYNEDPPVCHNSTSVIAACEPRKVNIIPATAGDSEWTKIDQLSLTKMIAKGVKHSIQPSKLEVIGKLSSSEEVEKPGSIENIPLDHPFKESVHHQTSQLEQTSGSETLKTENPQTIDQSSLLKATITQKIIDLLPHLEKSEELYRSHWIYGVDTGGQAAFIDIAPILLRYYSVNILTHKLDEDLNDKAKFFFSVEGTLIGEPVERQITNLQFLESSFRSGSSLNSHEMLNIHTKNVQEPYYIVLGTFWIKYWSLISLLMLKMKFSGQLWRNLGKSQLCINKQEMR